MEIATKVGMREFRQQFGEFVDAGKPVAITKHGKPIARVTHPPAAKKNRTSAPPGFLKAQGWKVIMADDFDAIPEGFEGYF